METRLDFPRKAELHYFDLFRICCRQPVFFLIFTTGVFIFPQRPMMNILRPKIIVNVYTVSEKATLGAGNNSGNPSSCRGSAPNPLGVASQRSRPRLLAGSNISPQEPPPFSACGSIFGHSGVANCGPLGFASSRKTVPDNESTTNVRSTANPRHIKMLYSLL